MRKGSVLLLLFIGSALFVAFSPLVGMQRIALASIFEPVATNTDASIFWEIRLPRVCLAYLAGAGLAVSGMVFQAVFRNALATPFTLGVSSGASLGAALSVRFGLAVTLWGISGVSFCAFLGALAAIGLVWGLTRLKSGASSGSSAATMLLAGVAVNFFFSSVILLVQYSSDFYDSYRILRWLMGGLEMVGFDSMLGVAPAVLLCTVVVAYLTRELNLITTGEELAISRGVAVERVKTALFFVISILVGHIIAVCGPIGFVGLMCPHICRLLIGSDHRWLLPATFFFGGGFLVLSDTLARTLLAPTEIPVGVVTSFLGGPFFLWLLLRPSASQMRPARSTSL